MVKRSEDAQSNNSLPYISSTTLSFGYFLLLSVTTVVLPGSKAVTSSYGKVSADTESLFSEDNVRVSKDRDYNKQWKSNVKGGKSSKSKKGIIYNLTKLAETRLILRTIDG